MGRIKQLDTLTANMIAAGEVVERPMGVVKELVENAIDAGSTRIEVNITEGGIQRLSVIDNGCGMDAQDAQLCFGRHDDIKDSITEMICGRFIRWDFVVKHYRQSLQYLEWY